MGIPIAAQPQYPFVTSCLLQSKDYRNCKKSGVTADLFLIAMRHAGFHEFDFKKYSYDGTVVTPCSDTEAYYASVPCGAVNATVNLLYLAHRLGAHLVDFSIPVESGETYVFVPRVPKDTFSVSGLFSMFDVYTWTTLLLTILVKKNLISHLSRLANLIGCTMLCYLLLMKTIRSSVLHHSLSSLILVPAWKNQNEIFEALAREKAQVTYTKWNKEWLLETAEYEMRNIVDLVAHRSSLEIITKSSRTPLKLVAESAKKYNGNSRTLVFTISSTAHLSDVDCKDRTYIHGLKYMTSHLAYAFTKRSNLTRIFNKSLKELFGLRGPKDFIEYRRRRYIKHNDCQSSSIGQPTKVSIFELHVTFYILCLCLALCIAVCLMECALSGRSIKNSSLYGKTEFTRTRSLKKVHHRSKPT